MFLYRLVPNPAPGEGVWSASKYASPRRQGRRGKKKKKKEKQKKKKKSRKEKKRLSASNGRNPPSTSKTARACVH